MRVVRVRWLRAAVLAIVCGGAWGASGHGVAPGPRLDPGDMQIGSTAARGGRLFVAFDFTAPVRAAFAGPLGPHSTFSSAAPGFDAPVRRDLTEGILFRLRPQTRVWIELLDTDGGRTALKVRDALLTRPGERAWLGAHGDGSLHHHPEYQLVLPGPPGDFGEGRLAFRLASDAPPYGPSSAYELVVSNGYLPAFTYDGDRFDAAGLRCHTTLATQVAVTLRAQARLLERCAVALPGCGDASGACLTPSGTAADPVAVAAEIAAGRAVARDAVVASCGNRLTGPAVESYLGMAGCRLDGAMRAGRAAADPICGAAMARQAGRFLLAKQAALSRCALAVEADKARQAAGLPAAPAIARTRCAYARGSDGDGRTLLGRVARARSRAARAVLAACGTGAAAEALEPAACGADDIASGEFATLKLDVEAFGARGNRGGRPLLDYLPCLRGGHAAEPPPAPERTG